MWSSSSTCNNTFFFVNLWAKKCLKSKVLKFPNSQSSFLFFFRPSFTNQDKISVFPKRNHYVNTKLEVRKIPRDLNNITKLNEHFSKFGTIVNIQVQSEQVMGKF